MKSFELDSDVRYNAFYLYTFSDETGKDYLSFLNYRTNQLLFYDWKTARFLSKVELDADGPNGVAQVSGYYAKDFNYLYVSSYAYSGLIRVDTTGRIVQKIPYGTTAKGYKVLPSYTPSSHPYIAPVFLKGSCISLSRIFLVSILWTILLSRCGLIRHNRFAKSFL